MGRYNGGFLRVDDECAGDSLDEERVWPAQPDEHGLIVRIRCSPRIRMSACGGFWPVAAEDGDDGTCDRSAIVELHAWAELNLSVLPSSFQTHSVARRGTGLPRQSIEKSGSAIRKEVRTPPASLVFCAPRRRVCDGADAGGCVVHPAAHTATATATTRRTPHRAVSHRGVEGSWSPHYRRYPVGTGERF